MSNKSKGINAERELVIFFNQRGWSAVRVAGSGSSHYPSADVLAGNAIRKLAIECKTTKERKKYFTREEVNQFLTFCRTFGVESWIAVKFHRQPWFFVPAEELEATGTCLSVSPELAQKKGVRFEELLALSRPPSGLSEQNI